ncbi:MAG TPA: hypothetical protein VJZ00_05865, partial [Thermoanaerobaculia bacterium]|nr:hypothetical protein [Thermoanaerobaculia bacterium]
LKQKDKLREVLEKHETLRIGWAVAIEEHLTPPKFRNFDIDFGLFDRDKVVSFFHNYSEVSNEPRRFDVFFNTYGRLQHDGKAFRDNEDMVERHLRGYHSLVEQCRLVSRRFERTHIGASERRDAFPIIAETAQEIAPKINELIELDRQTNRRANGRQKKSE